MTTISNNMIAMIDVVGVSKPYPYYIPADLIEHVYKRSCVLIEIKGEFRIGIVKHFRSSISYNGELKRVIAVKIKGVNQMLISKFQEYLIFPENEI